MAGDLPPDSGDEPMIQIETGERAATHLVPSAAPSPRPWLVTTLVAIAAVAVAALIVALTRPSAATSSATTMAPTYTGAETAAAHQQLCDTYSRAARAVQIESNGGGTALARIAAVNGAVMLEAAATVAALKADDRSAALGLARTYRDLTAVGSVVNGSGDPAWQSAIADVNAADGAMKKVCGGG
jgi:hypothetical protein